MSYTDHKSFLDAFDKAQRISLTKTSNRAGLQHLFVYLCCLGGMSCYVAYQAPFWPVMMVASGILIAFLFTLQHECTHNTPFRSRWLNTLIGHITGLLLCQPFLWFRHFHMAHHRHTNIKGKDPELAGGEKPECWQQFVWHLSTISYWRDKVVVLWQNATLSSQASYIPKHARRALQIEACFMLSFYGVVAGYVMAGHYWIVTLWLLPLMMGFPFLRLYLLAEHGRCPLVANMFENTRTVFTNKILCFFTWNMPYHTEHHILPAVPFHALPAFHEYTKDSLAVTNDGYYEFVNRYVADFGKMSGQR
ncbi:MAG: fatty acid desaturase [Candidatus Puniceispirillaceae bacterium]